jgi:hypothetical protein
MFSQMWENKNSLSQQVRYDLKISCQTLPFLISSWIDLIYNVGEKSSS